MQTSNSAQDAKVKLLSVTSPKHRTRIGAEHPAGQRCLQEHSTYHHVVSELLNHQNSESMHSIGTSLQGKEKQRQEILTRRRIAIQLFIQHRHFIEVCSGADMMRVETDLFQGGRVALVLGVVAAVVPPDGPGRRRGGGEVVVVVVVLDVGPGLRSEGRGGPEDLRLAFPLPGGGLGPLVRRRLLLLLLERLERREDVPAADPRLLRRAGAPAPSARHLRPPHSRRTKGGKEKIRSPGPDLRATA